VFSKSIALWLADNIDIIWISVDGPPSIQDVQRPQRGTCKSSEIVESNIATILGHQPNVTVGARSTITPLNLYRQVEMVEHFCRLRLKAMFSDPVFPRIGNSLANLKSLDVGSDFMMEYAREFLKARRRAEELGIFYGSILTVNFDEKTEYFCRSCTPCPHLTTDGYVSCCDMAAFGDTLSQLIYGEYNAQTGRIGYDNKKIAAIRSRRASNLAACRGCKILYFCAGGCVGEGVNETGNLLGVKKAYCDAIRFLAKHIPLEAGLYPYLHP
jgi:radical SAM protein with 4Fe4S-binding SPASM domain